MRIRILRVTLLAIVLAVLVTGIPAAVAISRIVSSSERTELEAAALRAAVRVGPAFVGGDAVELPRVEHGVELGVYDPRGHLTAGAGPDRLSADLSRRAIAGPVSTSGNGQLVEVVPVNNGERVIGSVRAASAASAVQARTTQWWLAVGASVVLALLSAGALALWEARRLARPIDELAGAVTALGSGSFDVRPIDSGVPELDNASNSLVGTAARLADLIDRERSFTARASHQLRTPLTRIQLALEAGLAGSDQDLRRAAEEAMVSADGLSQTIDDILTLSRDADRQGTFASPATVVEDVAGQWRGALAEDGRRLDVRVDPTLEAAIAPAVLRQAVGTLLDNALRHGEGTVTVTARESYGAVAVDVADDGTGPAIDIERDASLGLRLVVTLVERAGGRLVVDRSHGTRFTVLLPTRETVAPHSGTAP